MKTLHTFGDSHSKLSWGKVSIPWLDVKTHWMGPRLMFSFGRDGLAMLDISQPQHKVSNGDYVCFCFGEIDCRCHLNKFHDTYESEIKKLVAAYFEAIRQNVEKMRDIKVLVFMVTPTIFRGPKHDNPNGEFQYRGTPEQIRQYTEAMNLELDTQCTQNGYLFVDVYREYCDEIGFLNRKFSDSSCHIIDNRYIKEWCEQYLA